jgi:hypothetical protein
VLGVDVDTSQIKDDEFETPEDGSISRDEFFSAVAVGDTVSTNGKLIGDEVEWEEMERLQE